MVSEINPFDVASGKVVINHNGTFWFKGPGNNMQEDGRPIWKNLHRDNDLPAVIYTDGRQIWYKNGKRDRDNGPAYIDADGLQEWYKNGILYDYDHQAAIRVFLEQGLVKDDASYLDDGPAIILRSGSKFWYKNGEEMSLWDKIKSWFQK